MNETAHNVVPRGYGRRGLSAFCVDSKKIEVGALHRCSKMRKKAKISLCRSLVPFVVRAMGWGGHQGTKIRVVPQHEFLRQPGPNVHQKEEEQATMSCSTYMLSCGWRSHCNRLRCSAGLCPFSSKCLRALLLICLRPWQDMTPQGPTNEDDQDELATGANKKIRVCAPQDQSDVESLVSGLSKNLLLLVLSRGQQEMAEREAKDGSRRLAEDQLEGGLDG